MKQSQTKLLELFSNDINLVNKYIALVKIEIPKELDSLEIHLVSQNFKEASVITHAISGQCDYLAFYDCKKKIAKIELLLDTNPIQSDSIIILFKNLRDELENKLTAL